MPSTGGECRQPSWQPDLPDAGVSLGLFQDDPGAGVGEQGWEDVVDVPLANHLNGPLGGLHQLLVDVDIGVVHGDVLVLDVDIAPGESQNLADPHGAGKGQIHGEDGPAPDKANRRLPAEDGD